MRKEFKDIFDSSVIDNAYDFSDKLDEVVTPITSKDEKGQTDEVFAVVLGIALFVNDHLGGFGGDCYTAGTFFGLLMDRLAVLTETYGEIDIAQDEGFWEDFYKELNGRKKENWDPIPIYGNPDDIPKDGSIEELLKRLKDKDNEE